MNRLFRFVAFCLALLLSGFLLVDNKHLQVVNTVADLKNKPVDTYNAVLTVGKDSIGDGLGAVYFWNPVSTKAQDMTYLNALSSNVSATGKWERVNVRTMTLPHGTLTMNGGIKTFYTAGVTNSSGELTINLTLDGTAAGTPIFTKAPLFKQTNATNTVTSPNDFVWGGWKSTTTDFKQMTFSYVKGSAPVSAIVGLLINPVARPSVGTPVECRIEGP